MKKVLFPLAVAVTAGFAAGYAVRGDRSGSAASEERDGASASNASARLETSVASRQPGFTPRTAQAGPRQAPPFPSGQAAGWLERFAHERGATGDNSDVAFALNCGRLDAVGAEELAEACLRAKYHQSGGSSSETHPIAVERGWLTGVMARLAELDPGKALALLKHSDDESRPDDAIAAVFTEIARQSPGRARKALDQLAEEDRAAAAAALAKEWARRDPDAALSMLGGLKDVDSSRVICLRAIAKTEPDRALAIALDGITVDSGTTQSDESTSSSGLTELRELCSNDQMSQRLADLMCSGQEIGNPAMRKQILETLTSADSSLVCSRWPQLIAGLSSEDQAEATHTMAVHVSGSQEEANQWLSTTTDPSMRQQAVLALAQAAMSATTSYGSIGLGQCRTNANFISPIDGSPIAGVPTATATDATNIVTLGLRNDSGAISRNNIDAVLNQWNGSSLNPALEGWIQELPASPEREDLTLRLINRLQTFDPEHAAEWINTLPEGSQKDSLLHEALLRIELRALQQSDAVAGAPGQ